jgi:hypothetical protein
MFECKIGANLRQVLLEQGIDLYNNQAKLSNCHGIGTCGTCAVQRVRCLPRIGVTVRGDRSLLIILTAV